MKISTKKNLVVLFTEIAVILLVVSGIAPREAGLFSTGLLIFYFIFSPIKDSLWVFIASIPLFIALPVSESFDTIANWRILLIVLFLKLFFQYGISLSLAKNDKNRWRLTENVKHYRMGYLFGIFLFLNILSLFAAQDVWIGVKKIIFLINASLLFIIIRNLSGRDKKIISVLKSAVKTALGITLAIGFIQLIIVFFVPLFTFWQFWARRIIPFFYGQSLSDLLSYSNTWFSYYSYQLPTVRMFSIFPDSHSFAFFCILSLPFFLTRIFLAGSNIKRKSIYYLLLILCLLAIIFSGARGAWAGAVGLFLVFLFIIFLYYSPLIRNRTDFFVPAFYEKWKKQIQLIFGTLLIFFILFPIGSAILFLPQYFQLEREQRETEFGKFSFFERARSIINFDEISVKNRLEIWQKTADSIIIRPLLGVGIGNFPSILNEKLSSAKKGSSAHSLYLDVAAETGVFSLLVLLAIFWEIFKDAWNIFLKASQPLFYVWAGFFVLALIWILGYSVFDVVLLNDKVLLFFLANLGLLYSIKYETEKPISFS